MKLSLLGSLIVVFGQMMIHGTFEIHHRLTLSPFWLTKRTLYVELPMFLLSRPGAFEFLDRLLLINRLKIVTGCFFVYGFARLRS